MLSVNRAAKRIVDNLCNNADSYGVAVKETKLGSTIIDAGIQAKGGLLAGRIVTEICLGGYGTAEISLKQYDNLELPSISVFTDHPAISTLGSQFAGWRIKIGEYSAIGSGPARAIALKPRELYEKIEYEDKSDLALLVLETTSEPPDDVLQYISDQCHVAPNKLSVILVPTSAIAGSVQVSGRIVETAIHKLMEVGLDPKSVVSACGYAPIAPVHPKFAKAMGRTNDAILYGGIAVCAVRHSDDEKLKEIVEKTPSSVSKNYGLPFFEIFKGAGYDFYRIDPNLFAPAALVVNNIETGRVFKAGKVNSAVLKQSIGLSSD
jgi:methenyltetrahydromethanopterin cyclohydrolase